MKTPVNRRHFIASTAALAAASSLPMPAWARGGSLAHAKRGFGELSGEDINLAIGDAHFMTGGRSGHAYAVNGTVPGPLIRLREGQNVRLHVTNNLDEDSSIHWHGLLLPFQFDGVPGVSFPGIKPGETFTYEFPIRQTGTYWWHSHSGLQEQAGHYGPIIIESGEPDPRYDRDYIVLLSTLGGLRLFGVNGFVIGPLVAALFIAFWEIFIREVNIPNSGDALQSGQKPEA